jgi:hypothetical protein
MDFAGGLIAPRQLAKLRSKTDEKRANASAEPFSSSSAPRARRDVRIS